MPGKNPRLSRKRRKGVSDMEKGKNRCFVESSVKDDIKRRSAHLITFEPGTVFTDDFKSAMSRIFTLCLAKTIADFGNGKGGDLLETEEGVDKLLEACGTTFLGYIHSVINAEVKHETERIVRNIDVEQAFKLASGKAL